MYALYGENHRITGGQYDKSLAVKCVNGTFVGKKTDEKVVAFKGIPFVGKQPARLPLSAFTRPVEESIACTNEVMEALGCKTVADLQKVDVETLVKTEGALLGLGRRPFAEKAQPAHGHDLRRVQHTYGVRK